jgi:cysteinyl-tRNA synthetase
MKYLGDHLDIHCGGADHVDVHHTNEIAQSEAATGKPFFNFWMHGAFLNIAGGKKMAKSDENFLTLESTFLQKGINPLAFRFATFLTHYRKPMEHSDESVAAAQNGLRHLHNQVRSLQSASPDAGGGLPADFQAKFREAVNDDLNMPRVMAVVQEVLKSSLTDAEKLAAVLDYDRVLGLGLAELDREERLPAALRDLVERRQAARAAKNWALADQLRDEIQAMGYVVQDSRDGMKVVKA